MATYTTSVKVLLHLPSSPPSEVTNNTNNDIADASALVDSRVGPRFSLAYESEAQRFPDITSTPPTPPVIELAARYLAVYLQYIRLKETVAEGESSQADKYKKMADEIFKEIEENKIIVEVSSTDLKASALDVVQDEIYETDDEPVFNTDEINEHLY